ncbi:MULTISPECIES: hypothetical protein [Heyndrickxia]|uniref:hypothetical protein n=1 Tax=Heyndrickxia TaxID=2837504 RepID=UPI000D34A092|nr:hypothetical protein [Heyndrickxia sporothermodurans]MED3652086.1 hypothetical protein [Heyndrickxia sporothermodurans]MED3652829.1 hypothetical protein [Heyndrickxia sporothermodurans]MED3696756.1 hypothetical protein [Heyndrickxia sporothermodurans]PTY76857.1 hypothetical protein B5V89_16910 [Heyndrickxia sporothermodurans]
MKFAMYLRLTILFFIIILSGCSSKSWVANFVKYNDVIYHVSDEKIERVGYKLAEVKQYIDVEGDIPNLSSNEYREGTEIYSIDGIDTRQAIAVKVGKNKYIKLVSNDKK